MPPGKDREAGEVKALACWAVNGCEVRVSMIAVENPTEEDPVQERGNARSLYTACVRTRFPQRSDGPDVQEAR